MSSKSTDDIKELSRMARHLEICAIQIEQFDDDADGIIPDDAMEHIRKARRSLRVAADLINLGKSK